MRAESDKGEYDKSLDKGDRCRENRLGENSRENRDSLAEFRLQDFFFLYDFSDRE